MPVIFIGLGCGRSSVTREGLDALTNADVILGSARMLNALEDINIKNIKITAETRAAVRPEEILEILKLYIKKNQDTRENICLIYGGDTGFHSGAGKLAELLDREEIDYKILPGISSAQIFAARLGRSWQDWNLVSAHGVECDVIQAVSQGRPAFFLTDSRNTPDMLCRELVKAGLDDLKIMIAENLGDSREKILYLTAREAADVKCADLCVMLAEAAPEPVKLSGIPDDDFIRVSDGIRIPITKREVRAAIVSQMAAAPKDIIWDIGAGTGSVSIMLSMSARRVYAVERRPEAWDCIFKNREKFHAWNLNIIRGEAPEVLKSLPVPDAVLIGGSGGKLESILRYIIDHILPVKPSVKIRVSAVTLETLSESLNLLEKSGLKTNITQINISRAREIPPNPGSNHTRHMMLSENPVYLITADRE